MQFVEALILGIVQGLTEFFPVSSSGHLVMAQTLMGTDDQVGIVFEVAVHVATLFAILLYYHGRVWQIFIGTLRRNAAAIRYVGKLIVATIPAIVVALTARGFIEEAFQSPALVGVMLLITGGIVWSTRYTIAKGDAVEPSWRDALLIGCAQAFAILPGITRSGTTVAAAMALGMAPLAAAEFSFLLGTIAMAGAAVLLAPELASATPDFIANVLIGGAAALISGLLALIAFVWLLKSQKFFIFAWYAWGVGACFLAYVFLT